MSRPELLKDLCDELAPRLLDEFRNHAERLGTDSLGSSEFAQSIGNRAETVDLADRVQRMKPGIYENRDDVLDVCDGWLAEQMQRICDGAKPDFRSESLASRLESPLQDFEFTVPVSLVSELDLEIEIGGTDELRLVSSRLSPERTSIVLSGKVKTIGAKRAIEVVERHVRALIGLSVASGIGRLLTARNPEQVRARIECSAGTDDHAIDPRVASLSATMFSISDSAIVIDFATGGRRDEHVHLAEESVRRICRVVASREPVHLYSSALLFADAIACPNGGQSIAIAFMSLEALLLDDSKRDLLARLAEAVAYRLGTSSESRSELRKEVSKLYDQRSSYVHKGTVSSDGPSRADMLSLTARAIKKELDEI